MSWPNKLGHDTVTVVVVMGVSGCGKSTVAAALARLRGWVLLEGDAFHPPENIAKMQAGVPLTDADRWPWLHAIAARANMLRGQGESAVIACSALKRAYRDILTGGHPDVMLVYLRGSQAVIGGRMARRTDHFMPTALLDSQFATLEEPGPDEHPVTIDIGGEPEGVIKTIAKRLEERLR